MNRFSPTFLALTLAAALSPAAHAADASKLGTELTPAGGERAASKDGAIPAWAGNEAQHTGWTWGKYRGASFKYKGDKPLTLDITAPRRDTRDVELHGLQFRY